MRFPLKRAKRPAVATAVAIATIAATALATAAPASAWAPGELEVCSYGNYDSYVKFPWRGGWSTTLVNRGTCRTFYGFGSYTGVEPIEVRGVYNTSPNTFWIANGSYRPSKSGIVATYGTTAAGKHWAMVPAI